MAVKNYKPTSPGRRGASVLSFEGFAFFLITTGLVDVMHTEGSQFVTLVVDTSRNFVSSISRDRKMVCLQQ